LPPKTALGIVLMKLRLTLTLIAAVAGVFVWWSAAEPPATAQSAPADVVTLMLTFGNGATAAERWDGTVAVSGGEIVSLEDWQFSKDDSVAGNNSWKVQNRYEAITGFPRVNYNEMSPAELPPTF
jgi:hypothetical protein